MKKIRFLLVPLLALPIFTSCENKDASLKTIFKYCTVSGLKEDYKYGDRVELTITPYQYFSLPSKEDLFIGGVNNFDYDSNTGHLSFTLTSKVALMVEAISTFNGQVVSYLEAINWWNKHSSAPTAQSIHYKYHFEEMEKGSEEEHCILEIINSMFNYEEESYPLTDFTNDLILEGEDLDNITFPISGLKPFNANKTLYVIKDNSDDNQILAESYNIQIFKNTISGASGWMHASKCRAVDQFHVYMNDMIIRIITEESEYDLKPINGYIEVDATYNF